MTRLHAHTSLKVFVLCVLAALPLSASPNRPSSPSLPVTLVNPTVGDCYSGPGCLDSSVGFGAGKVTLDVAGRPQYAYTMAVQADGKTLVAGASMYQANPNGWDWVIVRFNADGTPDSGFGNSGVIKTHFYSGPGGPPAAGSLEQARAIAVQADGKIVVGGRGTSGTSAYTAVLRLNGADGSLDPTFGSGGVAMVPSLGVGVLWAMKIQPADGKIVLASNDPTSGGTVVRLNANGAVDTTFGSRGYRLLASATALGFQSNGSIIVGGSAVANTRTGSDFMLCRLTSAGGMESKFGTVTVDFFGQSDSLTSIAVASDDSIVAAGYSYQTSTATSANLTFARFTSAGALSSSFGSSGKVALDIYGGSGWAHDHPAATVVAIQSDGRIVFSGVAHLTDDSDSSGIVGRLTANGALDTTFNSTGVTATAFDIHAGFTTALLIGPNGITAAGYEYTQSNLDPNGLNSNKWLLARYFR